jgi:hypothetical protein
VRCAGGIEIFGVLIFKKIKSKVFLGSIKTLTDLKNNFKNQL